jgi:hypothetical protein
LRHHACSFPSGSLCTMGAMQASAKPRACYHALRGWSSLAACASITPACRGRHECQHWGERYKVCVRRARHKGISPLPVALVEGRRRAQWYPPGTTDSLGARKAKAHQINPVVAQSKIGRRPVDGFYARNFDLRQGRGRGFGRPQCPRLLRMCCKRPCRSHAYK